MNAPLCSRPVWLGSGKSRYYFGRYCPNWTYYLILIDWSCGFQLISVLLQATSQIWRHECPKYKSRSFNCWLSNLCMCYFAMADIWCKFNQRHFQASFVLCKLNLLFVRTYHGKLWRIEFIRSNQMYRMYWMYIYIGTNLL